LTHLFERLIGVLGACVLLALAFGLCPRARRKDVSARTVFGGLTLLVVTAFLILRTPAALLFASANTGVELLLGFTRQGASFVFGPLASTSSSFGYVFAFQVLPTILFFSALMSVLYHVGIMPFIIERAGRLLAKSLKVSGAEAFSTVADIFVGQTEAPLAIRPYLPSMTRSELNACMVAGFATTAGGVLAAYVSLLGKSVPGIAGHLIACSVMSAPASLVVAKLMLPESETPQTGEALRLNETRESVNVLDALVRGTLDGVRLAVNVAAMLIVFLAFTALFDAALAGIGRLFGVKLNLTLLLGWLFTPLAFCLGLPSEDVFKVAGLLGQKTVFNEFVAYSHMAEMLALDPHWLTERGRVVTSYALCGFANFGSIGIQIAGYSTLAPKRLGELSRLALRAMVGGLLTTCLVACVAGALL